MKILSTRSDGAKAGERGNIIVWCLIMVTVVTVASGVAMLVSQSSKVTQRRSQMIQAFQYAQGAVLISCNDVNNAMNSSGTFANNIVSGANAYTAVSSTLYQRTVAAPFSNQTVLVQIVLPSAASPSTAAITATATVGDVTQQATGNAKMGWAWPAAIISVNAGTTDTSNGKTAGKDGNVAINGGNTGPIVVNGGNGYAVLANGRVNLDTNYVTPSIYSMTNWGSANQIPDYTAQGTTNALFDLNRFIAVADLTPGGPSPSKNNHFTNIANFVTAANKNTNSVHALEGVVVVDVNFNDSNIGDLDTPAKIPAGINVKGTLLFNFIGVGWDPVTEKFKCSVSLNVNPANLVGVVATNPATYTTGYPPTFINSARDPRNIDITSKGFANFVAGDDLPALIYSTGCLDMHGNVNVCGVLYTPCYIELENKQAGQNQYINGCVICGHGIYYNNNTAATSIISFDPNTVDSLATWGNVGKMFSITYWSP